MVVDGMSDARMMVWPGSKSVGSMSEGSLSISSSVVTSTTLAVRDMTEVGVCVCEVFGVIHDPLLLFKVRLRNHQRAERTSWSAVNNSSFPKRKVGRS